MRSNILSKLIFASSVWYSDRAYYGLCVLMKDTGNTRAPLRGQLMPPATLAEGRCWYENVHMMHTSTRYQIIGDLIMPRDMLEISLHNAVSLLASWRFSFCETLYFECIKIKKILKTYEYEYRILLCINSKIPRTVFRLQTLPTLIAQGHWCAYGNAIHACLWLRGTSNRTTLMIKTRNESPSLGKKRCSLSTLVVFVHQTWWWNNARCGRTPLAPTYTRPIQLLVARFGPKIYVWHTKPSAKWWTYTVTAMQLGEIPTACSSMRKRRRDRWTMNAGQ